jgi:hypothetical protein
MPEAPSRRALCIAMAVAAPLAGCALPTPKAQLPPHDRYYVAVLSGQMPPPIDEVSRHSWIVTHAAGDHTYRRFEMGGGSSTDPYQDFAAGDVQLHGVVTFDDRVAFDQKIGCLEVAERKYHDVHPGYFPIPGPNSNTLVAMLIRECGLGVELPATAIGRDYVGPLGVARTEAGTGVQLGSIPLGLRIGLKEGVELQLFGLPLGVHGWPPGINVPVNPGRIGFAREGHRARPFEPSMSRPAGTMLEHEAVGTVTMHSALGVVADPRAAGGLYGQGGVGMLARAAYGSTVGYGVGLDFDLGFSAPFGFVGGVHLYPAGVVYMFGSTGFIGLFSGIGTWGASSTVPAGLELPNELRLAFDVGTLARLSAVARGTFVALEPSRREGKTPFDEFMMGAYAHFGALRGMGSKGVAGSGYFFGLERRELMGTAMLSLVFGTTIDAGYGKLRVEEEPRRWRRRPRRPPRRHDEFDEIDDE